MLSLTKYFACHNLIQTGCANKWATSCTFLKLPDFNSLNNDGHHEENSQTAQGQSQGASYSIRLLYKKEYYIRLSVF